MKFIPFLGHHLKLQDQCIHLIRLLLLLSDRGWVAVFPVPPAGR